MKVIGLDNKEYVLQLRKNSRRLSDLQAEAYLVLKELYPTQNIYAEVNIPGTGFRLDFFIPSQRLIVEVHGAQHYERSTLFHKSELDFKRSCNRDSVKLEWAELNGFDYAELPFDRKSEWKTILLNT